MVGRILHNELEEIWKEALLPQIELILLLWHLYRGVKLPHVAAEIGASLLPEYTSNSELIRLVLRFTVSTLPAKPHLREADHLQIMGFVMKSF
jgi:hypothetical protein